MMHDYTPKEIADATVQASYQHPELRGLDIPPVKAILDALPEPEIRLGRRLDDVLAQHRPRPEWAKGGKLPSGLPMVFAGPVTTRTWTLEDIHKFNRTELPKYYERYNGMPITKVRRGFISNSYGTITHWHWNCRLCPAKSTYSEWDITYYEATRHAHNHHGDKQ